MKYTLQLPEMRIKKGEVEGRNELIALRKRYNSEEAAAKLREAEELAAKGKTQQEIALALGVSVMTIHRWRKRRNERTDMRVIVPSSSDSVSVEGAGRERAVGERTEDQIRQMELENSRLRRLVTDLLLEKVKLEEELRQGSERRADTRAGRKR